MLSSVIRPRREQEPRQWLSSAPLNSYPITSEATPHTVFKPPAQERSPSFHLPVDISTAEGSNYRICLKASRTDALRQGDSGFFRLTIDFQFH